MISTDLMLINTNAEETSYVDDLIESAIKKELYKDKYWHILLHYKKNIFGIRSLIDDPKFFLSKDGKHNPQKELKATIRAFFKHSNDEGAHPICRFMARFTWLKEKLDLDESQLPEYTCKRYNDILESIKPKSASIIFPTSYVNSPASMFGHTLIIIESDNKSKLLSHAVNYSALTDESFGLFFAFRGIFGLYKGYFSVLPYYKKVLEYSDFNQRDIWEYRLNLTEREVIRMVMHLTELENIYSDYFFFDENCSYNLLFLLDAAKPSLALTDNLGWWVIPIDTIRDVKEMGLIEEIDYRPSKSTRINHIASLLSKRNKELASSIIDGEVEADTILQNNLQKEEQINICDLITEYIQYKYTKKRIQKEEYSRIFIKILKIRSELGEPDENRYRIPSPGQPDEGHKSSRISIGIGIKEELFQEIGYRAAYHDLLDPDEGYIQGSQIQFCNIKLRYYNCENRIKLQKIDFIDVLSISPWNKFFMPISWKITTGLKQKDLSDEKDNLIFQLNPGGGLAYEFPFIGLCYFMIETNLNLSGKLENNYSTGIGCSFGLLNNLTDYWKIHLYSKNYYYGLGDRHKEYDLALHQRIKLTTNNTCNLEFLWTNVFDTWHKELTLSWNLFF